MPKLSVDQLEVKNRRVLVRVDFNVPLEGGRVADDTRIMATIPTIETLINKQARIVLLSHLGRPKGKAVPELSLEPVARKLAELLDRPVGFCPQVSGPEVRKAVQELVPGGILLLENVRFHPGEEKNDPELSREFAGLGEVFVFDAFGTAHRAHSSTEGAPRLFSQVACGKLMATELEFLEKIRNKPGRPLVAVLGGAKVSDKIGIITNLLEKSDTVLIGGAMAYTFLHAMGRKTGASLVEKDSVALARELLEKAPLLGKTLLTPLDHRVAPAMDSNQVQVCDVDIPDGMIGLDIGPVTEMAYSNSLRRAKTVLWNGPMGMFEKSEFRSGTFAIARTLADSRAVSIVGGGDSAAALNMAGLSKKISHVCTGGGASLEYLEGRELPGIKVLTEV